MAPIIRSSIGRRAIVPEWLLDVASGNAVKLFAIIDAKYADRDGVGWPSRRTLAHDLGVKSPRTVDAAIAELEECGAIRTSARSDLRGQTSNLYRLIHNPPTPSSELLGPLATPLAADRAPVTPSYPVDTRTPGTRSIDRGRRGGLRAIGDVLREAQGA